MPALVVDASVASAWCFPDEQTEYTNGVLRAISHSFDAVVPRLWNYEIYNNVLIGVRRKRVTHNHAMQFFASIYDLKIRSVDPASMEIVYTLANDNGLTIYDAAYLELALREKLALATLDKALQKAADAVGIILFKP